MLPQVWGGIPDQSMCIAVAHATGAGSTLACPSPGCTDAVTGTQPPLEPSMHLDDRPCAASVAAAAEACVGLASSPLHVRRGPCCSLLEDEENDDRRRHTHARHAVYFTLRPVSASRLSSTRSRQRRRRRGRRVKMKRDFSHTEFSPQRCYSACCPPHPN